MKFKLTALAVVFLAICCWLLFWSLDRTENAKPILMKPNPEKNIDTVSSASGTAPSTASTTASNTAPTTTPANENAKPVDMAFAEETSAEESKEERAEKIREAIEKKWEEQLEAFSDEEKKKPVTASDRRRMAELFNQIKDDDDKNFSINQAVNELPDEAISLLNDILFDKKQDKNTLSTIFNDILNRDEAVKKPIIEAIAADKEHPLYEDAKEISDNDDSK